MKIIKCLMLLSLLSFSACSASEDEDILINDVSTDVQQRRLEKTDYNILVIGNSYSRDAFSYVPFIMNEVFPDIHFHVEILYRGGEKLENHWNSIKYNVADYILDHYNYDKNRWTLQSNVVAKNVIDSVKWDMVVLQEQSQCARFYDSTQPPICNIVDYIRAAHPNVVFAFMIDPPYADGHSYLGDLTSDELWMEYVRTAQNLVERGDIDYIIPCGTGIQNARHTFLDSLGNFGHLTFDGRHLQEGIPCLIDAYTASQSILNIIGINASIVSSKLKVTQNWVNRVRIRGQHGSVITGEEERYNTAKQCALNAVENPYEIMADEIRQY